MNLYMGDLKAPYHPQYCSTDSVISGITTPFSFIIIDQNFTSVKNSNQYQYSKYFPDNSIYLEGTNLMSIFDNNSLKKLLLNPLLNMNVLIFIMLNQIVVLIFC